MDRARKKIEDFKKYSAKIVIILDNASFHKRKDILEKIEAEMPNIILDRTYATVTYERLPRTRPRTLGEQGV
jgi:hypothetical protein